MKSEWQKNNQIFTLCRTKHFEHWNTNFYIFSILGKCGQNSELSDDYTKNFVKSQNRKMAQELAILESIPNSEVLQTTFRL